jgi:hypothetical protein
LSRRCIQRGEREREQVLRTRQAQRERHEVLTPSTVQVPPSPLQQTRCCQAALPGRKEQGVDRVAIGVDQTLSVRRWDFGPQPRQCLDAAVTDLISQDLPAVTGNRCPKPEVCPLADAEFIYLYGILLKADQSPGKRW